MATQLGEIMREIRTTENERLLDMARKLSVSSAFLSAIEHGRKVPPKDFAGRLCAQYKVSALIERQIVKEVDASVAGVTIRANGMLARETASVFARKVNKLSDAKLKEIRNLIDRGN